MKLLGRRLRPSSTTKHGNEHTPNDLLPNQIERLEGRMMLAGDVTFSVSGNNLSVKGTGGDDCVEIGTAEGQVTVNGESTGILSRALNNVKIKTLGGNDQVIIGGNSGTVEIGGNLKVITKAGNDNVLIYDTEVAGKATIKTAAGEDKVATFNTFFSGKTKVVTGADNDQVRVALPTFVDSMSNRARSESYVHYGGLNVEFDAPVKVNLGSGNDELNLGGVAMEGSVEAAVPVGIVFFDSSASANGGSGNDFLKIGGSFVNPDDLPSDAAIQVKNFEASFIEF